MLDGAAHDVPTARFYDNLIVSQYRTGYRGLMLLQGASVKVKQPSHLNNFIMKNLS